MRTFLLLIIACCLLFGADKTKKGIGCLLKIIAVGIILLVVMTYLLSY